ncbi:MAG: pyrroline-5-carboxylate reductase [Deltaproteobacteria bacterium GWA2_45_12]|nr:MAG: pyrroline-5-carboxylate reductase [Deltaproteobacteria bacterium GWA2_45_12]
MKTGFLGTGNMAEALIAGLIKSKTLKPKEIFGFDLDTTKLKKIQKKYRIQTCNTATELALKSGTLVLSVKPQNMAEALRTIQATINSKHLLVSIAAGLSTDTISLMAGKQIRLVRVMPNTPALVGTGAAGFYANKNCNPKDKKRVQKIFESVGIAVEMKNEDDLDSVTGLSGSGPAYVYAFAEALITGAAECGLDEPTAKKLALQTLMGAAKLMLQSKDTPSELMAKVASKGGTTEAGLKILETQNFRQTVIDCVKAATQRAKELKQIM